MNLLQTLSRRHLFQTSTMGLGSLALGSLLARDLPADEINMPSTGAEHSERPVRPNKPARAKNVIFIHLVGAPSHLDLFDYKPELQRLDGQLIPDHLWQGLRLTFIRKQPRLLGTQMKFAKHGQSGFELSELLPHLSTVADELRMINSRHTE